MNQEKFKPIGGVEQLVVKGVVVSGAGNALMRLLEFGVSLLFLRWLSLFEFGAYRLSLAAYDFAASFFLAGVENVVVSDVSGALESDRKKAQNLFSVYFYFMVLVGLLLWALFFFAGRAATEWSGGGAAYLKIISFLFLLAPLETYFKLKFQIFLDFKWGAFYRVFRDVGRIIFVFIFFSLFSFGAKEAVWSLASAMGLPIIAALFGYRRPSLLVFPSFSEAKESLAALFFKHGKWALLDDFVNNIGQNLRPFIVKIFVGIEAVALISVAQNLVSYAISVFPIRDILTPIFPRFSEDARRLGAQINRAVKYSIAIYLLLGLAAAFGVPILVRVLFPKYLPSLPLFYVLLFGLPWLGFRSVALPVFYALKKQRVLFLLTVFRLLVITVLGILLIYFFGIWGAAFEMLLGGIIVTPAFARALRSILPEWKFSLGDLFVFDNQDKEFLLRTKKRLVAKALSFL